MTLFFLFRISLLTSGKQMLVYHSDLTLRRCSYASVATWLVMPKKQTIICFNVLLPRTTFVGFCWIHLGRPIQFITVADNIYMGEEVIPSKMSSTPNFHENSCWSKKFACFWTKFPSTFFASTKLITKQASWIYQPLFRVPKTVGHLIYVWCAGTKEWLGVKSGLYSW